MTVERVEVKPKTNHEGDKSLLASFFNEPFFNEALPDSFFRVQPKAMRSRVWERDKEIIRRYKDRGEDIGSHCKEVAHEMNVRDQAVYDGLRRAVYLVLSQSPLEIREKYPLDLLRGALREGNSIGLPKDRELAYELKREDLDKIDIKRLMSKVTLDFLEINKHMFTLIPSLIKQLNKTGEFDFPLSTEAESFVEILREEGVVVEKREFIRNGVKRTVHFILKTDRDDAMDILSQSKEVRNLEHDIIWKRRH